MSADSEQPEGGLATNAIDGNPATIWHTAYAPTSAPLPHVFSIAMGSSEIITGLRYQPRTDHPNGRIGQYQIHLSVDGTTWGNPLATGTFADDATEKTVTFTSTAARFVRLTALTEAGNRGPWSSAAEIDPLIGIQCGPSARIYSVKPDGTLWLRQHRAPATGANSWGTAQLIGTGFTADARHIAGPDGVIYSAVSNGELRRRRWNGTGWDTFAGGAQYEVVDRNPDWARYSTPDNLDKIAVDSRGDIYTVDAAQYLVWHSYHPETRTWSSRLVKWVPNTRTIMAAGKGVIHTWGQRIEYDPVTQRLMSWYTVGLSALTMQRLFSPGADVVYTVLNTGELQWLRYDPDARTWVNGVVDRTAVGLPIGTGWQGDTATFAAPDACELAGRVLWPQRPPIPPWDNAPVSLNKSTVNFSIMYAYVDADGRAVYAEASDLTGATPIRLAAVPGVAGLAGTVHTIGYNGGGGMILGTDPSGLQHGSSHSGFAQPWDIGTELGGYFRRPAFIPASLDVILTAYALDDDGSVWKRELTESSQIAPAWQKSTLSVPANPGESGLAFVPGHSRLFKVVYYDRAARSFKYVVYSSGGTPTAPRDLGGPTFLDLPPAVVVDTNHEHPGDRAIFAIGTDGVVYGQPVFPTSWTAIPGVRAAGPPSATMGADLKIKLAVRATDGLIYYTSQTTPDSTAFDPWLPVPNSDETVTDPSILAADGTWFLAYRTDLDLPRLRRFVPNAVASTDSGPFLDIPMVPPV